MQRICGCSCDTRAICWRWGLAATKEVFEDPFEFRIDRSPNPHLAFGIGEHFCLGSHVARLEMQVAYKHLLPRIEEIELAGPPERLRSSLVGGVKHLPIRYRLKR